MSHAIIDQLFQISTPTPVGPRASRGNGGAEGELFRSHLERATEVTEPKQLAPKDRRPEVPSASEANEDEPLEAQTEQQRNSTTEQEETPSTVDSQEQDEHVEETPTDSEPEDEVVLSASAVQVAADSVVPTEITETAPTVAGAVDTSTADQQSSDGQLPANFVETTDGTTATGTPTTTEQATQTLASGSVESEAAGTSLELGSNSEGKQASTQQEANSAADTFATSSKQPGTVNPQNSAANATLASQQTATASEAALETEASKSTNRNAKSRHDSQPTTSVANEAVAAVETELANTNFNSPAEASTPSPASPAGNETVAGAGRTLGSLLVDKSGNPTTKVEGIEKVETPTVDRARFVQRVGGAIRNAQQRDGQIQLRLSPPELGTLRIQIVMKEGVLSAQLETETIAARTILLDNLPALRERLSEQNITIEKFDVDVGREGQQQADDPSADERQDNKTRPQASKSSNAAKAPKAGSSETESDPTQPTTASGLDVRI